MMRTLILAVSCLFSASLSAAIAVVVHPSNSATLSKDELSRLYTGRTSNFPDGNTALPVNLADASTLRAHFDEKALGRSSSQMKAYWSKLVFTGKGSPPLEVASASEVLKLVANNPNTIGYVDASEVTAAVKVVLTID
jgi:ABC-type phosphate transport system substrate-binding protein